jgi:hypothetical protein
VPQGRVRCAHSDYERSKTVWQAERQAAFPLYRQCKMAKLIPAKNEKDLSYPAANGLTVSKKMNICKGLSDEKKEL